MLKSKKSDGSEGNNGEVGKPDRPGTSDALCAIFINTIVNEYRTEAFVLLRVPKAMVDCPSELSAL